MKHIDQKVIEKILQVKELADRGHKGEADAARIMLHKLMLKHHLTLDDLNRMTDKKLWQHEESNAYGKLVAKVMGTYLGFERVNSGGFHIYQMRSGRWQFKGQLYDYEIIELEIMINWYKSLYKREVAAFKKRFEEAFSAKHDLGARNPNPQPNKAENLTPDEIDKLRSIYNGLSDASYRKALFPTT